MTLGWRLLIAAAALLASVGGGYRWGHTAAATSCAAKANNIITKAESAEDARDANIEQAGQAARDQAAAAQADTKGAADASAERIRTVVVPADCRDLPADVVHEHAGTVERINAKVRGGVRPGAAVGGGAGPDD